jgi:hypothetical protein
MASGKDYTFLVKPSNRLTRLVVNCDQIDQADVYVLAIYNEQLDRAWLLGYATKADLKGAPKGSRITDSENCPWKNMSYYMLPSQLKPMRAIIKNLGLTDVPEGILLEAPPEAEAIPLPSKVNVSMLEDAPADDGTDFDELLGLKSTKKAAAAEKKAPAPPPDVISPEVEKPKIETPKPEPKAEEPKPETKAQPEPKDEFAF